jgi:hypothetical protein
MDLAYLGYVGVALHENQETAMHEEEDIVEVIEDKEVVEID